MIYLYGGYESNGKFNSDKLCYCNFDVNDFSKSKWGNIKIKVDDPKILPGACCNMVPYEENIIITGGTNGEHLLDGIFELKISEKENNEISIDNLGKTKTARNNAHILMRDGDVLLVGGAIKEYKFNGYGDIKTKKKKTNENCFNYDRSIISIISYLLFLRRRKTTRANNRR